MKFILGRKLKMTQIFSANGKVIPVTAVEAGPCKITQVKTIKKDGYSAAQVGFGFKKKLTKPIKGHLKDLGDFRYLKEFFLSEGQDVSKGQLITVSVFEVGDNVKVTGTTKGKGFQGGVKRHGFHGQKASHGHKDQERMPGSIGSTGPQRVLPGTRMAGRMGGEQSTVSNLQIVNVEPEKNLLYVLGALPGAFNGLVAIYGAGELKEIIPSELRNATEANITEAEPDKEETNNEQAITERK